MKNQLYIPKKINVGFQEREDTYTGLLAYVIYWDDKGKLRKETSWDSWRHKPGDKKYGGYYDDNGKWQRSEGVYGDNVKARAIENVPTSGFVLNKGVGGQRESYGWNARNEYIRIYDPRGFEFEISVANLLFILQECTSTKGKGLEGEFVYSWQGKELVLLPCSSLEYKQSTEFTGLQSKKITKADMLPGCSYTAKDGKKLIYLGRYNYSVMGYVYEKDDSKRYSWERNYVHKLITSKKHIFIDEEWDNDEYSSKYVIQTGFTKLATRNTEEPVDNFSDLLEEYLSSKYGSAPLDFKLTPKKVNFGAIDEDYDFWRKEIDGTYYTIKDGVVESYSIYQEDDYDSGKFIGYIIEPNYVYKIKNGNIIRNYANSGSDKTKSREEIESMEFYHCEVELANGNKIEVKEYE